MVHNAFMCCCLGRILSSIFITKTDTGLSFSVFVMYLCDLTGLGLVSAVPSARAASVQERRMWPGPSSVLCQGLHLSGRN